MDKKINNNHGFTLIEMLVAIGIIVVLIAAIVPVLSSYEPTMQLSGAVQDLISDIRYVQQLTVTEQVEYCIVFYPSLLEYEVIQCGESEALEKRQLPDGIQSLSAAGFTDNTIRYNPYGAVSESGSITLTNIKGEEEIIQVSPSGFVKTND